eukprot:g11608.t1
MLNERQTKVVIRKVNEDIDVPFLSERREERIIEKFVERVLPKVEPSMRAIMPDIYVRCIKEALDETQSIKSRRKHISTLLRGELSEPLTRQLNERVDCSIIPEKWEGKVLKLVSNKVIDEFVEWTVGEVDERLRVIPDSDRSADLDRSSPEPDSKMPESEGVRRPSDLPLKEVFRGIQGGTNCFVPGGYSIYLFGENVKGPRGRSGPTTMLNEKQKHTVIDKVNEDIDVPWISEGRERKAIEKLVDKVVPEMEPSLNAILPPAYVELIKIALKERLTHEQRKERMSKILREELSAPFASQLNERVDCSFIPESIEGKVLKVVANKLVDEFVESALDKDDGTEA